MLEDSKLDPVPNEQIVKFIEEGKDELVLRHNIRLIYKLALYYKGKGEQLEELAHVGAIGLMRAIKRYSPEKGLFTTYASFWIKREMRELFRSSKLILLSSSYAATISKVRKLAFKLERDPTVEEVAAHFETFEEVAKRYLFEYNKQIINDEELLDLASPPVRETFEKEIGLALHVLDEREKKIIIRRYGLDGQDAQVLEEVSQSLNITRERVRQIQNEALRKMKIVLNELEDIPVKLTDAELTLNIPFNGATVDAYEPFEYATKFIVLMNTKPVDAKKFITDKYLSENQTFLLFVDTTPRAGLKGMINYRPIAMHYPDSERVLRLAFWAGDIMNPDEEDYWKLCDIVKRSTYVPGEIEIQVINYLTD